MLQLNLRLPRAGALLLAAGALCAGCATVQETGRKQVTFFPDSYVTQMGLAAYEEETSKYPLITSGKDYEMVQRLGERIAKASGRDYDWEFRLLDAPGTVNAFALPGGKVAVYTGILKVAENEDGLAAVVGHEVAHATSHHGNERMSQSGLLTGALMLGQVFLGWTDIGEDTQAQVMSALGVGGQLGVLAYSRDHESEADEIGLRFLIRAGYDPYEAPKLWERMAKLGGARQPELLSTHPDPQKRAERLRELIPQFLEEEGR